MLFWTIICMTVKQLCKNPKEIREFMSLNCIYLLFERALVRCCVRHCKDVTVLVGCQRYQGDCCSPSDIYSLLNITSYQWQASTGVYTLNGYRHTSQRNSQTGDTGSAMAAFWTRCYFVVLSVCTDFVSLSTSHYDCSNMDCLFKCLGQWEQTLQI